MARPFIVVNGGTAGEKYSATAGETITLTLDSTTGVRSVQWSIETTDETTETTDYTLVQSGSLGQTCTFTAGAAGTALIAKVVTNNGLVRGLPDPDESSNTVKVFVPTAEGLEVGAAGETYESDATHGTTGILNAPIRVLNTFTTSLYENDIKRAKASATANVALTGDPSPMDGQTIVTGDIVFLSAQTAPAENGLWKVNTAGAWSRPDNFTTQAAIRGCIIAVVLGTARAGYFYQNTNASTITVGTTALTFSRLPDRFDRTDLANASATPGSTILTRYGSASELNASYLTSNSANPASTGFIRAIKNVVGLAFRNDGNTGDLEAVVAEATDVLRYGNALVEELKLSVKSAGIIDLLSNGVSFLKASTSGLVFGKTNTMSITQEVQLGVAGTDATIEAQAGDAGFAGADITIASGSAGSGSTPGNIVLDAKASATASGRISFKGGAFGEFVGMTYTDSTSTTMIDVASDIVVFDTKELLFPATNLSIFASSGSYGGGTQVIFIANATATPSTDPTGGGILYVEAGSLWFRGSSGTATQLAVA